MSIVLGTVPAWTSAGSLALAFVILAAIDAIDAEIKWKSSAPWVNVMAENDEQRQRGQRDRRPSWRPCSSCTSLYSVAMNLGTAVAQSTPITGWQIASTIATATAAVAAITVAIQNLVQRAMDQREKKAEAKARLLKQARLIVLENKDYKKRDSGQSNDLNTRAWVKIHNHSDRAVLDLNFEVWPSYASVSDVPAKRHVDVLPTGVVRSLVPL
ncbi:hypothetical protein [Amycolatopsis sp. WAC 01416]|uniref:hypothetical protein n=1 Tax=Amycolatopsis sp. WAC 01416 TaxID=2203196 RepID=UPI000F77CD9A|nr:hypothetical protein [Amycolatopsis sp. WAC 01416]